MASAADPDPTQRMEKTISTRPTVSPRRSYSKAQLDEIAQRYRTWGRWGSDDEAGSLNYITRERRAAAGALIRAGKSFSLAIPLDRNGPMPARSARVNPQHVMYKHGGDLLADWDNAQHGMQSTDDGIYMPLQCATQWDAFCHVFYDGVTYNGHGPQTVTSQGAVHNSIAQVSDRVVGRGVLLDFPRFFGVDWLEPEAAIQDVDVEACAEAQGVEIGEGDIVLIRTGHMRRRREEGEEHWGDYAAGPAPGLGVSAADYLLPRKIAAVASDTWGLESVPSESLPEAKFALHVIFLVNAGVLIGEMWDLDQLAADCAADGIYEFFLSAQPLTVTGAVGSPLNPIAVK
ncbi:cyclase family protein [Rhodococcus sp. T7]|uniref:cyclase family protein n=1 Tax=Rhodococcus sp. T7 TaxID=627444 RepID=UPI001F1A1D5D|nr:cyclase family protein [Rhodococcus sp. T7]